MNDRLDQVISRRSFLRQGACASLGLGGLASQLFMTRMVNAALADNSFGDYRALVCVFLFGGNDNGNTLIPYDGGDQNFSYYQFTRGNLAIPQGSLASTIIAPTNTGGRRFALNPSMTDMKALFDSGNLAVLTNVGTLVEPTTKAAMQADDVQLPRQLFAHNWQQEQWQFSTADAIEKVGWGGRVADILQSANVNPGAAVSMGISIAGANVFLTGQQVVPYAVSPWGVRTLTTWGLGNGTEQGIARQAYADLLALQGNPSYAGRHLMQKAYADITDRAIMNSEIVDAVLENPSGIATPVPEDNYLASQLSMVARLIEYGQAGLNHNRQIFFVAIGGFDNHDGLVGNGVDPGPHDLRLAEVNDGLKFFWDALGDLGMRDQVTTFTASDFGRTYVSNGNGSDHGWGADHFVMGGSQVAGGKMYGTYPNLSIDGTEDTGSGRFIPTTSVDAYSFELARWMGVPLSEMSTIFPNLSRFLDVNDAGTQLGYMV